MSRSRRSFPIISVTTSTSEKRDKRIANRRLRRGVRIALGQDRLLPELRQVSDVWAFNKDGKTYLANPTEKDMRK